jgi:hypothetical protein
VTARGQREHRITRGWQATMFGCVHFKKLSAAIVAAAITLVGAVNCYAQTGTIHLTVVKAGFIVSTGSGTGTLDYRGRTYRLSVSSFGSGTIGVSGGEREMQAPAWLPVNVQDILLVERFGS